MPPAIGALRFLYVGSADVRRDVAWYVDVLGAKKVWILDGFGTQVGAVQLGTGPPVLVAGHRPPKSVLLLYEVPNLAQAEKAMRARGWQATHEVVETPSGPCRVLADPSGNEIGLFEDVRPGVMEHFARESEG